MLPFNNIANGRLQVARENFATTVRDASATASVGSSFSAVGDGMALVESGCAVGLGTVVSDNSVETAVRYTAWWCAVIGGDIGL